MSSIFAREVCCAMSGTGCVRFLSRFFFQAEDGIRDLVRSRGLGDVYKRQATSLLKSGAATRMLIFSGNFLHEIRQRRA